jgi:DNA (cytosine-5)-methyltransferase 1
MGIFVNELLVDNFAGGGGASTGIEQAIGRPVDIAINHDEDALDMHTLNHPHTRHYCESVWDVDPREITNGLPVGLAWFSPDCKHFSKAKGSIPVNKNIRGLAWVAVRWAATVKPRIIILENVEEFISWGPVVNGVPCKKRKGKTFNSFKKALERHGYQVDFKTLVAADYGVPTTRKRFFMIARCDGLPIVWPKQTHSKDGENGLKKWVPASSIIDWSIPCPSIFTRKKPLAENTQRRIARGLKKFVLDDPNPFIVRIGQQGFGGDGMQYSVDDPLTTITTKAEHCLVAPYIQPYYGDKSPIARGRKLDNPIATQTTENRFSIIAASIVKHYGGNYTGPGSDLDKPLPTITTVDHNALVTSYLQRDFGKSTGSSMNQPVPTITAGGGGHVAEVRAFLLKYYGTNIGHSLNDPLQTITTKHRFGLVTVHGEEYQIVDIGMRMLEPHELYAAQGFESDYIINRKLDGSRRTKKDQVHRVGNSVCPGLAEALVSANYSEIQQSAVV